MDDCARCWDRDVKIAALEWVVRLLEARLPPSRARVGRMVNDGSPAEWWASPADGLLTYHPTLPAALRAAGYPAEAGAVEAALRGGR